VLHEARHRHQDSDKRLHVDGATTDPVQKAVRDSLIAFKAATAQAQAEATKEPRGSESRKGQRHPYGQNVDPRLRFKELKRVDCCPGVCTENLIRVDDVTESLKLAE
jgi:hypothetical protein